MSLGKVAWEICIGQRKSASSCLGRVGEAHEMIIPVDEVA
jgi:hypothetical protein